MRNRRLSLWFVVVATSAWMGCDSDTLSHRAEDDPQPIPNQAPDDIPEPDAPFIERIDPAIGVPGEVARIRGSGFGPERGFSSLRFNGTAAGDVIAWADDLVTVTIPLSASSGDVFVTVGGRDSNAYPYTISMPNGGAVFEDPMCITTGVTPKSSVGIPGVAFGGIGALYFLPDGSELWVASDPAVATTEIWAIPLERDPTTRRILRFLPARRVMSAPNVDGGLDLAADGTMFVTEWPSNILGAITSPFSNAQLGPSTSLDSSVASVGGIHFDEARLGATTALVSGFETSTIGTVTLGLTMDEVTASSVNVVLTGVNGPEGLHFVPTGIRAGKLFVNAWSGGQILVYDWPPASTTAVPEVFLRVTNPYGIDFDPLTGDLVFSAIEPVTQASGIYHVAGCQ